MDAERASVRDHDLVRDVEAETEPARSATARAALEGLEELRPARDGRSFVPDLDGRVGRSGIVSHGDANVRAVRAVLDRVADEIGDDLREALAIPAADHGIVSVGLERERSPREARQVLVDDLGDEVTKR